MKNTWNLILVLIVSLLTTCVFSQKNVVWKKVGSKKKAEKYLSGAKEIKNKNIFGKDKKNSDALKIFKGALIKKYDIAEDDPYFNVGSGEESSGAKSVSGGTNQNHIISLRREDVSDPRAFRDAEYAKAKQETAPPNVIDGEENSNYESRKYRCYEYTIGNVAEGRGDYKKESQCFLIQADGYVAGEDPDIHNHDSKKNSVKTNSLTTGCLKIAKCEPRGLKVKISSGGRSTMKEGEKQSLWEKVFKRNRSKKKSKESDIFNQKDSNLSIQSCVGGCSEGFRLVRVKYALDGEEGPIRDKIAQHCQNLASDRYNSAPDDTTYFEPFSKAYSSNMEPITGYVEEHDKNAASEHFIYVNKCVQEDGEDAFGGDSGNNSRRRRGESYRGSKTRYNANSDSNRRNKGYRGGKLADNLVNNGNIIINYQDASGSKGAVLNNGGPGGNGWINGAGAINAIPGYATMYPSFSGGMAYPGLIVIDPRMLGVGMNMVQAGNYLPMNGTMVNGNFVNNGIITQNGYGQGSQTHSTPTHIQSNGTTYDAGSIPPECWKEELVDQGQVSCQVKREYTDVIPTGQSLKEIYEQLCEQASSEDFEETEISLQSQCVEVFKKQIGSLSIKDSQESGDSIHDLARKYRKSSYEVGEVGVETALLNSAKVRCVDRTPVEVKTNYVVQDNDWGIESKYEFVSLDPSDPENKKNFSKSELKQLEKFYNGAVKNAENGLSYSMEALDYKKVSDFEKLEQITKDSWMKLDFQNLYSYQVDSKGRSVSADRARERQQVNVAMLKGKMKQRFDEMLQKQKLTSKDRSRADEIFDRVVSDNSDTLKPTLIGPLPYTKDDKEMKRRADESYTTCADKGSAENIYKCSLRAGCSEFRNSDAMDVIPKPLEYCLDINPMGDNDFEKWYANTSNQLNAKDGEPATAVVNFFGAHADLHRDSSLVTPDSNNTEVIKITCDLVNHDGAIARKMLVRSIEYKNKGKISKMMPDLNCVLEHTNDLRAYLDALKQRSTASE